MTMQTPGQIVDETKKMRQDIDQTRDIRLNYGTPGPEIQTSRLTITVGNCGTVGPDT
jgi:hypothetical protein